MVKTEKWWHTLVGASNFLSVDLTLMTVLLFERTEWLASEHARSVVIIVMKTAMLQYASFIWKSNWHAPCSLFTWRWKGFQKRFTLGPGFTGLGIQALQALFSCKTKEQTPQNLDVLAVFSVLKMALYFPRNLEGALGDAILSLFLVTLDLLDPLSEQSQICACLSKSL